MRQMQHAVEVLASLGGVTTPVFTTERNHQNTLGQGISNLYVGLQNPAGKITMWLFIRPSVATPWAEQLIEKRAGEQKIVIQGFMEIFLRNRKKLLRKIAAEDIKCVDMLFNAIEENDPIAEAAIWYPMFMYWARLNNRSFYAATKMQEMLQVMVTEYGIPNKDQLRKLLDAGLLQHINLESFMRKYDSEVGKNYEREVVGYSAKPTEKEVTEVPLDLRTRNWELQKRKFEMGTTAAVKALIEYKKLNQALEGKGHRAWIEYMRENPKRAINFVQECKSIPGFAEIMEIGRVMPNRGFSLRNAGYGTRLVNFMEEVAKLTSEEEGLEDEAINVIFNMAHLLKAAFNLEDAK